MKKAFITGITGQDGSYLAELLLEKNYEVHGLIRRSSSFNTARIDHIFDKMHMHFGDMTDEASLSKVLTEVQPDEIYNLAAQSHVRVSFDVPVYSADADALGVMRLLEAAKTVCPEARIYQAGSSEMFGSSSPPQNEDTPFHPRSPYGCAKVFAHNVCVNYREAYDMFISNGILFNHESERRGETFVTRKIAKAVAHIKAGLQDKVLLGNLDSQRDWGYSKDYVKAMWLMLQSTKPDDYVIATGETYSVRDFLDEAFGYVGLDWHNYVEQHSRYYRPAEVDVLLGDSSKARKALGWSPTISFKELVRIMVDSEVKNVRP